MARVVCMVQQGQASERKQDELAERLAALGRETFGDPPGDPDLRWVSIPDGYGFTAGRPSTSSLVIRTVPPGYPDDQREAFLLRVCDLWQDVTGCTKDEIVVTAFDGPLPL